jgi:hypothetical protein
MIVIVHQKYDCHRSEIISRLSLLIIMQLKQNQSEWILVSK